MQLEANIITVVIISTLSAIATTYIIYAPQGLIQDFVSGEKGNIVFFSIFKEQNKLNTNNY